jgi:site-specific recombinase XerD
MRTNDGYRNRIILEILYDTGIRAAEMAAIKMNDLDLVNGYLTVRCGKGAKDRVVPLSSRVCTLINTYLLMVRPVMIQGKDKGYLVLNRRLGHRQTLYATLRYQKECYHPYLPPQLCNPYAEERCTYPPYPGAAGP